MNPSHELGMGSSFYQRNIHVNIFDIFGRNLRRLEMHLKRGKAKIKNWPIKTGNGI